MSKQLVVKKAGMVDPDTYDWSVEIKFDHGVLLVYRPVDNPNYGRELVHAYSPARWLEIEMVQR